MNSKYSWRCCGYSQALPIPPQQKQEPKQPLFEIELKPEPKPNLKPKLEPIVVPKPEPVIEKVKEVNLLPSKDVKPIQVDKQGSISQPNQDKQQFDKALSTVLDRSKVFQDNKKEIENKLNALFKQDQNKFRDCSENPDFCGPRIANRNICDIKNKYDFSQVYQFKEYIGNITIVRLIQKQKSPICTYLGKIEDKYCCVKLLPMAKKDDIKKWIERVYQVQKKPDDAIIEIFGQKYQYYKIEEVKNEQEYCNCYIISNLEQYNAYTFSHHLSITLADKVRVAYEAILVISLILKSKTLLSESSLNERLSVQIFKKLGTLKKNNLLISRDQNNNGEYKLLLSDWQLLLDEFEMIIPNQKLQNENKNFEQCQLLLQSESGNIRNSTFTSEEKEFYKNMQELDEFIKKVLFLIFFRVNYEFHDDVELKGFINETKLKNIKENIKKIQGKVKEEHQQLKNYIILQYSKFEKEEEKDKLGRQMKTINQGQLPQLICQEFGFKNSENNYLLLKIYIMLEVLSAEEMRVPLSEMLEQHQLK